MVTGYFSSDIVNLLYSVKCLLYLIWFSLAPVILHCEPAIPKRMSEYLVTPLCFPFTKAERKQPSFSFFKSNVCRIIFYSIMPLRLCGHRLNPLTQRVTTSSGRILLSRCRLYDVPGRFRRGPQRFITEMRVPLRHLRALVR